MRHSWNKVKQVYIDAKKVYHLSCINGISNLYITIKVFFWWDIFPCQQDGNLYITTYQKHLHDVSCINNISNLFVDIKKFCDGKIILDQTKVDYLKFLTTKITTKLGLNHEVSNSYKIFHTQVGTNTRIEKIIIIFIVC